jgi:D-serine deaminase-like pyridoxal phosphate-dependent protein
MPAPPAPPDLPDDRQPTLIDADHALRIRLDLTIARLEQATRDRDAPLAAVDLASFDSNAADLPRRGSPLPIRVASKSVRCRELLRRVLARPGYHGVLAYSLREALWLVSTRVCDDVVVAYPTADRGALRELAADAEAARAVTLMVDAVEQLDLLDAVVPPSGRAPLQVCIDLDASWRIADGRVHLGVRRSPVHAPQHAAALAREVLARPGLTLVGLMSYEAQVAGLGDAPANPVRGVAIRRLQRRSMSELVARRGAVVAAVRQVLDDAEAPPLRFVNAGGTGSLEVTATDPAVTELAAGSGLYAPTLFDSYRSFTPNPAAFYAVPVVRRPAAGLVTVAGGGWSASGPAGRDRSPTPVWPRGLHLMGTEGAGEVQTPLQGAAADDLRIGDLVWFRHAKAGELCEHVDTLLLVAPDGSVTETPTYRGEGRSFG